VQAFSRPVNVYVDTPLRDIVNRLSERVKKVGLLVRPVPADQARNILPALSTPFLVGPKILTPRVTQGSVPFCLCQDLGLIREGSRMHSGGVDGWGCTVGAFGHLVAV